MLSSYAGKPYTSPTWRSTEWATGGKGPNAVAHAHRFRLRGCMRGESLSDPILTCVHCAATPSAKNGHATQHLPRPPNAPRVFGEMLELAFRLRIDVLPRASRPDRSTLDSQLRTKVGGGPAAWRALREKEKRK
ncbi:hypothetical protein SEVIR_6G020200v4 [Setaria viridis]